MLLSNYEIQKSLASKEIKIEPFVPDNVGPDSIDIRLGKELLIAKCTGRIVDPRKEINMEFKEHNLEKKPYTLKPGDFVLGTTLERIGLSNKITGQLEGRSSIGRLGIIIHMTAGLVHAGWAYKKPSTLTLEISSVNPNPVYLCQGMKIAQMSFMRLGVPSMGYYEREGSKYNSQDRPMPSKIHHDYRKR